MTTTILAESIIRPMGNAKAFAELVDLVLLMPRSIMHADMNGGFLLIMQQVSNLI